MIKPIDQLGFGPKREVVEDGEGGYLIMVTPPKALGPRPTVTVPLTADQHARYLQWQDGMLIQHALHDLSASDREMLITGLDDDDFYKATRGGK